MKKISLLLLAMMILICGCENKQSKNTTLEKGDTTTDKVIIIDGKITEGASNWSKFFLETTTAKASKNENLNSTIKIEYQYNDILVDGIEPTIYEIELRYKNGKYIYRNLSEGIYETYEYLVERSGKNNNVETKTRGYYLVDNQDVTYEQLTWSVLSSQSTDWIKHKMIYTETIE